MATPLSPCPICQLASKTAVNAGGVEVQCRRCGSFTLTDVAARILTRLAPGQPANLSGWIRENQGCSITERRLQELSQIKTPAVGEKGDKLLLFLAAKFPKPGGKFHIDYDKKSAGESDALQDRYVHADELLGVSWAEDVRELGFLVGDYLATEKGALAFESSGFVKGFHSITPKGWSQVEALRHGDIKSDRGFVAMWFDKSMDAADVTIGAAIREAGYRAVRLDRHEHNNRIDDEILAGIRRSKFVVADLTGQRGGVYFEAGFALGLGIPVIWLCRKDDMAKIHFDNRQYNFILWEEGKLAELSKALQNRIEATIGRGPSAGST
jgi:nucleoside 2-deoxyribosyltransferase